MAVETNMTKDELKKYKDYMTRLGLRYFDAKPVMRKIKIITIFGK